jgi:hypothetical protein
MFDEIVELSLADCSKNIWFSLYNEESGKYISFQEGDEHIRR